MITQIAPAQETPAQPKSTDDAIMLLGIADEAQSIALKEWLRHTQDSPIPNRKELKPERIVQSLPVASLIGVEWEDNEPRFVARIQGSFSSMVFGETQGRSFADTYTPEHLKQILPAFHEAAHRGRVTLTPVSTQSAEGAPFVYTRLLLPYTDETGKVVRILTVYGFNNEHLSLLNEPLPIGNTMRATGAGRHFASHSNSRMRTG